MNDSLASIMYAFAKFESTTLLIEYEPFMKFESNNAEFIRILYEFLTDWKKWLSSNFKMLC